jgi:hypothetical protein
MVRLKFDQSNPVRETWNISTDHTAIFSRKPNSFLASILSSKHLEFEYSPYDKREHVAGFDLADAATTLKALADACPAKK